MRPQHRIDSPVKIDRIAIEKEMGEGKLVIFQFSEEPYSNKILEELNELCLNYDDNFSVRFYGHYSGAFDCKTLLKLPNIKSLWLDCLLRVDHLEVLNELINLRRLSLGIFELKENEILKWEVFKNLGELIIGDTRTRKIDLRYLENIKDLASLVIGGQTKNIDAVRKLTDLKHLGLSSISKVPLGFVNKLKGLKSLDLVLGGRENLEEIEDNEIEKLEIVRVRAFNNFKNVSNFKKLKILLIEDQIQLEELFFDEDLPCLEELRILNCKTFRSLSGLQRLRGLRQLRIYKTDIEFDEFINQEYPDSLDIFSFVTTKTRADKEIKERLLKLGYRDGR